MIDFKQKNSKYEVSTQRQKGVYNSGIFLLHNHSPIIIYLNYKLRLQFDNAALVVDQNNYATNIVNAYIVYDLDTWP